jgi:hypothetical protein
VIAGSASLPVIERQTAQPLLSRVTSWSRRRRVSSPVGGGEKPTTDGSAGVDGPPATTSRAVEATPDEDISGDSISICRGEFGCDQSPRPVVPSGPLKRCLLMSMAVHVQVGFVKCAECKARDSLLRSVVRPVPPRATVVGVEGASGQEPAKPVAPPGSKRVRRLRDAATQFLGPTRPAREACDPSAGTRRNGLCGIALDPSSSTHRPWRRPRRTLRDQASEKLAAGYSVSRTLGLRDRRSGTAHQASNMMTVRPLAQSEAATMP